MMNECKDNVAFLLSVSRPTSWIEHYSMDEEDCSSTKSEGRQPVAMVVHNPVIVQLWRNRLCIILVSPNSFLSGIVWNFNFCSELSYAVQHLLTKLWSPFS